MSKSVCKSMAYRVGPNFNTRGAGNQQKREHQHHLKNLSNSQIPAKHSIK